MAANVVLIQSIFTFLCSISRASGSIPIFPVSTPLEGGESLDPAFVKLINISTIPNIVCHIRNITVPNLSNCTSKKSLYDNEELTFEFLCDTTIRGDYFMQSKINPDEKVDNEFYVFLKNLSISLQYFVEESKGEDGIAYYKLKDRQYKSSFSFNRKEQQISLVDINEYIGQALTEYSKDHDVISIITQPIMDEVFKKVELSLRLYFQITPIKDIEL